MSPRPDYSSNRFRSGNPFKTWLERKKERRAQLDEEASRLVINQTASNIASIRQTLDLIDFENSKLPNAVLNEKSDPSQSYCDLEESVHYLSQELRDHPEIIKVDLRKIDAQLAKLALLLKHSVEQGNETAAYAAKVALATGIERIRFQVPENQPEFLTDFIDLNAKYLGEWVTLVMISQTIDNEKQACERRRARVQEDLRASENELSAFREQLSRDKEYSEALQQMLDSDSPASRSQWTPLQRKIHTDMIRSKMKSVVAELNVLLLEQQENRLTIKEQQKETLYAKLMIPPSFEDPDLLNKFKLTVDELFDEIATVDAQLDEAMSAMDDISGRIKQFSFTPGNTKANEIFIEQVQQMTKQLKEEQERLIQPAVAETVTPSVGSGILSKEEVEKLKAQQTARNQTVEIETQVNQQRLYES